jgi:ferritin-like metal-binding protein YciE
MIHPTVHLNGTSKDELLRQWLDAYHALREAREKMFDAMPHGRDYYPQGDGVIYKAQDEHRARIEKINEVLHDLETLAEGVQ